MLITTFHRHHIAKPLLAEVGFITIYYLGLYFFSNIPIFSVRNRVIEVSEF